MKIDKKNKKILAILDRDCRLSANQIAKKTSLSKEAVNYRIKQLEDKEIIEGYFAQIDFFKLGYKLIRLYIKLQNTSEEIIQKIIAETLKEQKLWSLYEIDGRYDLAIGLMVKNLDEYLTFQNTFVSKFGEYISEKDVSTFTGIAYFPKKYLHETEKNIDTYYIRETPGEEKIDDIDKAILRLLAENAKIHMLKISSKVNLTPNAVKYRIEQMKKKKIILAYRAKTQSKALGYQYYKIDLTLNDTSIIPALREIIKNHPNITFEDICIGGSDFEFDGEFQNDEEMLEMINKLYKSFPRKIRSYSYYKARKIHLYRYFPLE